MPLSAGDKLGPYEILSPLGAGGMGEVYRARDSKLNRDVAIKVLPASLANDAQYMARFEREAQMLAALNHPNIATVYGIEQGALVMELIEGADLPCPLPLDEALPIAKQIAEGLEAAHERNIIHRDLKPANIKITPAGVVKILDFGLAKSTDPNASASRSTPTISPTLSLAMTQAGLIMGTAAYMSPEQASGKPVDRRADIWSFGVVFHEMLTGERLFNGETVSHILADVLKGPIDLDSKLPKEIPKAIRDLLRRCVDRNVKTRLRDIGEARITLSGDLAPPAPVAAPPGKQARVWPAVACILALALAGTSWRLWRVLRTDLPMVQLDLDTGERVETPSVSPEGDRIVFVGENEKGTHLAMRRLDQTNVSVLAGTEGAMSVPPFFSPDGQSVGFFTKEKMKKLSFDGGSPISLADVNEPGGGSWGADGMIAAPASYTKNGVRRIPAAGGSFEALIPSTPGVDTIDPVVLPRGRGLIYTVRESWPAFQYTLRIAASGKWEAHDLLKNASGARYLDGGYLLFHRDGKIFAAPFDLDSLKLTGAAVPMVDGVADRVGLAEYSVSSNGTLVYRRGGAAGRLVIRIDSAGGKQKIVGPGGYLYPRVSPDGKMLALTDVADPKGRVVVHDFASGATRRLVLDDRPQLNPAWTADGRQIAFRSGSNTLITRADGAGEPAVLFQDASAYLTSFSRDGKWAAGYFQLADKSEVWVAPVERGSGPLRIGKKVTVARGEASALSPDGRWVAYMSDETGGYRVYLASLTADGRAAGGKWQVSSVRGYDPRWTANGGQLFLEDERSGISFISIPLKGETFVPSPERVFTTQPTTHFPAAQLDVMPDGKQVIEVVDADALTPDTHLRVILNFGDEVRRRLAGARK